MANAIRAAERPGRGVQHRASAYISPKYAAPGAPPDRQIRETYQDRDTGLIYMTDGNGGGLTVLRWTGPIPPNPPIPGAR